FSQHFLSNFSKEFYHWLMVSHNEAQRLSYEQYGSKLAFAFRHAHSEIFLFCFFFFCPKQPRRFGAKDFADFIKIHKPLVMPEARIVYRLCWV
ncbi:hypothetical protein, partial [uncultured Algibacter sp.]|uniref:hypothetical protein n=1 Tax=uncultured Algibacter sp. TaxID=298659 RepID=UPI0032172281